MHRFLLTFTCALAPSIALADALEDRFFAAQEQFMGRMTEFYVSRAPNLAGKFPDFLNDPRSREALSCSLAYIRENAGEASAETYVSSIEALGAEPFESLEDLSNAPEGVPEDVLFGALEACDSMAVSQALMEESGFMDEMRKPETMQALIAE